MYRNNLYVRIIFTHSAYLLLSLTSSADLHKNRCVTFFEFSLVFHFSCVCKFDQPFFARNVEQSKRIIFWTIMTRNEYIANMLKMAPANVIVPHCHWRWCCCCCYWFSKPWLVSQSIKMPMNRWNFYYKKMSIVPQNHLK